MFYSWWKWCPLYKELCCSLSPHDKINNQVNLFRFTTSKLTFCHDWSIIVNCNHPFESFHSICILVQKIMLFTFPSLWISWVLNNWFQFFVQGPVLKYSYFFFRPTLKKCLTAGSFSFYDPLRLSFLHKTIQNRLEMLGNWNFRNFVGVFTEGSKMQTKLKKYVGFYIALVLIWF